MNTTSESSQASTSKAASTEAASRRAKEARRVEREVRCAVVLHALEERKRATVGMLTAHVPHEFFSVWQSLRQLEREGKVMRQAQWWSVVPTSEAVKTGDTEPQR